MKKPKNKRLHFTFYRSFYEAIKLIPDKTKQADLYNAIFELMLNFSEPKDEKKLEQSVWILIKPIVLNSCKNYLNGSKPKRSKTEANSKQNRSNKDKDKDKDKEALTSIYLSYTKLVCPSSKLTDNAKKKIQARLKTYKEEDLIKAMENFSKSKWWMDNNNGRGMAWFFHSDDRIDQFLNLHPVDNNKVEYVDSRRYE